MFRLGHLPLMVLLRSTMPNGLNYGIRLAEEIGVLMTKSFLLALLSCVIASHAIAKDKPIDRYALVSRHNVELKKFDAERPLQVGNGEFAFGMDVTGLQTFIPFNTMSHWGWHTSPLSPGVKVSDFQGQVWDTHGRGVRYPMYDVEHPEVSQWLASSPHRINLGRVGLNLKKKDGTLATQNDIKNAVQKLDLWTGVVTSRFELEGTPVTVITACHPTQDTVGVKVESPLVAAKRLSVFFACPGNNPLQFANFVGDWTSPGKFIETKSGEVNKAYFTRTIDADSYSMSVRWQPGAELHRPETGLKSSLKILSAKYGAGDKWVDVTSAVTQRIQDGMLSFSIGNSLAPDPALGTVKQFRMTYSLDGVEKSIEGKENDHILIDPFPEKRQLSLSSSSNTLEFSCAFSPAKQIKSVPVSNDVIAASKKGWSAFWKSGGAIDLSESKDPRWKELERRIVLSQYLMKVNEAGSLPPQESGLVNNGWYGKFHLEMIWWHEAHYGLWNRFDDLNKSIGLYQRILPKALERAKSEGYKGAHWPKCIGPTNLEWPHEIHALLMWQQPHPIFFAEMDYRAHPTKATLEKWKPVVEATADFLASYAFYDAKTKRYVLGPPIHLASENTDPKISMNPTFELGYWRFGLRTAQTWRKRLGLKENADWAKVQKGLSPLPIENDLYVLYEGVPDMWTKFAFEHPALTATYGLLPGDGANPETMRKTLAKISSTWNFNHTWGWDFPMLAMCAARIGEPEKAIDFLMTSAPGFQFDDRGLATGGPFPYFPSNGGLLYAVAMMSAGWDGAPKGNAPGFATKDGKWKVRWEGLKKAI